MELKFFFNKFLETFEQLQVVEWKSLKRDIEQCKKFTNDINNCENYVLHMTSYNSSHLFFCGSNSINPKNAFFGIKVRFLKLLEISQKLLK